MAIRGFTAALLFAAPSAAFADPSIISVGLDRPPEVGHPVNLRVRAVDSRSAVSGMVVSFGRGEGAFGLSACRLPGSSGRPPGPPFAPGVPVRLSVPHVFAAPGARPVLARIDSGDCGGPAGSVLQPATVTPTRRGEPPVPLLLGAPVSVPTGTDGTGLPGVPGDALPDLPALPPVGLPLPSPLASRVHSSSARTLRACPGVTRAIRGTRRGRRAGRRGLLCLLNLVRARAGLRRVHDNGRLSRAASRHSRVMVRSGFFAHTEPGGVGLLARLVRVRYIPRRRSWGAGENLAFGTGAAGSPLAITVAWLNSPHHRTNMLARSFREVGIGLARGVPAGTSRGATVTTDFGYRR